jgi:hypothetical protein
MYYFCEWQAATDSIGVLALGPKMSEHFETPKVFVLMPRELKMMLF